MISVLGIVLPVFALILSGWLVRRFDVMAAEAVRELNRFVVYLALPAVLFSVIAEASWHELWQPNFVAVFGLSCAAVFVLTLLIHARRSGFDADGTILGLAAAYPNTAYLGLPLLLTAFGPSSQTLTLIATLFIACVLFAGAIVVIELRLHAGQHPLRIALKVTKSLATNPLIIAPIAGAFFPVTGLELPHSLQVFLKLLGAAASPVALVALGVFLAGKTPKAKGESAGMNAALVALKLMVQPALAWALGTYVFPLPTAALHAAVLLAMLPTGTGPFMLAGFYEREAGATARVILISTIVSIVTISGYLAIIS